MSQYPKLEDGESFRYNSYHVVSENSRASGAFFGETALASSSSCWPKPDPLVPWPDWAG